ncbi:MAG: pyridoxamine 5'-phosphate oxidase family protein [Acidimicrobiia bacterium]|nr:pyridoxamine 5'-phosphate oxidase family protein [Acidimicrobiia bacterium]MDH5237252.1 pyridoxamine 5'-phosphate oxidase family protein [Acidimicrobiia bacterium]
MADNRRDQIRMTDEELETFIAQQKSLQVAVNGHDGFPHLSTLWFAIVDGELVFETYTKSQKIKNLHRDPRITVLLEDGTTYETLRGVMIRGQAELVTDHEKVHPLALAVMTRNQPDIPEEMLSQAAEHMALKRTAVVVKAEKVVSWDHTKLGGSD